VDDILAGGGVGTVGHGDLVLAGLLGVARLLGDDGDTTVLSGLDTEGLEGCTLGFEFNTNVRRPEKYLVVGVASILEKKVSHQLYNH
jgi:hypothetical protein